MSYIFYRFSHIIFVIFGVTLLVFFLVRMSGDPVALYLPDDATDEQRALLTERLGLDQPVFTQYMVFLKNTLRGDFGMSIWHRRPALDLVLERLPATVQLTLIALSFSVLIAIPIGVLSALWRNSIFDVIARVFGLMALSIPNFWLGIMLILIFSVNLNLLPSFGRGELRHLIMPAITLGASAAGTIMRLVRSSVLEKLNEDYVRTARAKGLAEKIVIAKHVLRNAALPTFTYVGLQLGYFLSGSVVTETVFAYPGIGRLAIQSIYNRDFAVVQVFVAIAALIFALTNLAVDIFYVFLDPKIRYE